MAYVARTPGQKCQRCGKDNSNRVAGTKWCYECAKIINREAIKRKRAYLLSLEARDKPKIIANKGTGKPACGLCNEPIQYAFIFCPMCGQRIGWSD